MYWPPLESIVKPHANTAFVRTERASKTYQQMFGPEKHQEAQSSHRNLYLELQKSNEKWLEKEAETLDHMTDQTFWGKYKKFFIQHSNS